jgi:hypothetical protein
VYTEPGKLYQKYKPKETKSGKLDEDKKLTLEDLKADYELKNFTSMKDLDDFNKVISKDQINYTFRENRYNVLKDCNDNLDDKTACTALGNLLIDIYLGKLMPLKNSSNGKIFFASGLKEGDVAISNSASKELLADVRNARENALKEWKEIAGPFIDDLIQAAKNKLPPGSKYKSPADFESKMKNALHMDAWFSQGEIKGNYFLAQKDAEFSMYSKVDAGSTNIGTKKITSLFNRRKQHPALKSQSILNSEKMTTPEKVLKLRNLADDIFKNLEKKYSVDSKIGKILFKYDENGEKLVNEKIWNIAKNYKRYEDREHLSKELNQIPIFSPKNLKVKEFLNLDAEDVENIQELYMALSRLGINPSHGPRVGAEMGILEKFGQSSDVMGMGPANMNVTLKSVLTYSKDGIGDKTAMSDIDKAIEFLNLVKKYDEPLTQSLKNTLAYQQEIIESVYKVDHPGVVVQSRFVGDDFTAGGVPSRETYDKQMALLAQPAPGLNIKPTRQSAAGIQYKREGNKPIVIGEITNAGEYLVSGEVIQKNFTKLLEADKTYSPFVGKIDIRPMRIGTTNQMIFKIDYLDENSFAIYKNWSMKAKYDFRRKIKECIEKSLPPGDEIKLIDW